jgi:Carboxypeptidase regulatory-like domain/TonB dependent receptor
MYPRDRKSSISSLLSFCALIALLLVLAVPCQGQSGDATLGGLVTDKSGAIVQGAAVKITGLDTGITRDVRTNRSGLFTVPGLNPGRYSVHVKHPGFADVEMIGITLNVEDKRQLEIALKPGNASETVTVNGEGETINTTDGTVGSVIDRKFIQDIPLNGRSFQSLIMLSPGVVTASPQGSDAYGDFSVNGQRTTSNNYTLDGASASNSPGTVGTGPGSAGATSSVSTLGTTQSIISVDALQEFRIATSSYSAQFGRQPGAQIGFTSRSGTNQYHGTAFDYLRNYAFDANDWFNDYSTPVLAKPQERQNDFGGVVGGPLSVPGLFSAKDRAFFFLNYEGLRLNQPVPSTIFYVPSNGTFNTGKYSKPQYMNLRANAPAVLQPILNGFPLPNCSTAINPQCIDNADGTSPFIISTASPSKLDTMSGRLDFTLTQWLRLFARYSDTESSSTGIYQGGASYAQTQRRNRIFLVGADSVFGSSLTNEFRVQYAPSMTAYPTNGQSIGGSVSVSGINDAVNLQTMQGIPVVGISEFLLEFSKEGDNYPKVYSKNSGAAQNQWNITDTVSWAYRTQLFKAGVDRRQTSSNYGGTYSRCPVVEYEYTSGDTVIANTTAKTSVQNCLGQAPKTTNLGLFVQDEWRLKPRVSLSLGLRWDFNPPLAINGAQQYTYTGDVHNPSSLALSKLGAPMYKSTYTNFAPRFGIAYTLHNQPGHELVLRAGGGLFFDAGQSFTGSVGDGKSFGASNSLTTKSANKQPFPLAANIITSPISTDPGLAPYTLTYVVNPQFTPPSTVQWSASLEQGLGLAQSITLSYVANGGRNLSVFKEYSLKNLSSVFSTIEEYDNGPGSSYNSMQMQYKRQMAHGLQVIASYTWAHALDSASEDYGNGVNLPQKGNSSHDVRHNFTSALIYNFPSHQKLPWQRALLGNWDTSLRFVARSAFPVQAAGADVTDPVTGDEYSSRLNYNGANPYISVAGIPGGRQFNPAVFSVPLSGQTGNSPRNFLRGFGENATDLAVQRVFPLYEQFKLQFRAEAFNIFNRPNFGHINIDCDETIAGAVCSNPLMGQATSTLSNSGPGALASIYQQGGPRSLQFALKLEF